MWTWIGAIAGAWIGASAWCAWYALTQMDKADDRCLCGAYDLTDLHAHWVGVYGQMDMIHERGRCFPSRERVQS